MVNHSFANGQNNLWRKNPELLDLRHFKVILSMLSTICLNLMKTFKAMFTTTFEAMYEPCAGKTEVICLDDELTKV